MRPIYLLVDSGVTEEERHAAEDAVKMAAEIYGNRKYECLGTRPMLTNRRVDIDDLLMGVKTVAVKDYGIQKDATGIAEAILQCPRMGQAPFIGVVLTSYDLSAQSSSGHYANFCFGITRECVTVQSVARLRNMKQNDEAIMIFGLIMHELGHVFGITDRVTNVEENLGLHCTNHGCMMNQGLSLNALYQNFAMAIVLRRAYCPDCMNTLMSRSFRF